MINYREILFLSYEKKMGSREIAASVRCSKSAVNEFIDAIGDPAKLVITASL